MSIEGRGSEGGRNGGGVWQTYLRLGQHWSSSHLPAGLPQLNDRQFWLPPELLGCPGCQLVYDSGVLDGLHTHVPSEAASVPPIHTALPAAAVSSSAFSAAVCTLASCRPAARQAALASLHDRASFISVYTGGEGEGEGGAAERHWQPSSRVGLASHIVFLVSICMATRSSAKRAGRPPRRPGEALSL